MNVKVWTASTVGQMVCVNLPPLTALAANWQASATLIKRVPCRKERFQVPKSIAPCRDYLQYLIANTHLIDIVALVGSKHTQWSFKKQTHRRYSMTLQEKGRMNLLITRMLTSVKRQTDYGTESAFLALKPRMTPSNLHQSYDVTLSHDTESVANDSRASLSAAFPPYT